MDRPDVRGGKGGGRRGVRAGRVLLHGPRGAGGAGAGAAAADRGCVSFSLVWGGWSAFVLWANVMLCLGVDGPLSIFDGFTLLSLTLEIPPPHKKKTVAKKYDLPLILHTRKAEARTFEILQEMGVTKADFHCFGGKAKLGKKVRGGLSADVIVVFFVLWVGRFGEEDMCAG